MDERSSAFFALGLAKSTLNPVVVLSTSGTAAANFFPAIIEASLSRVPIIILSADRPKNLVGTGSNQTINQEHLYGNHVRYFKDVGLPLKNMDSLEEILQQAMNYLKGSDLEHPPGPIHLNFPFDEPLLPEDLRTLGISKYSFKSSIKNIGNTDDIQILPKSSKPTNC